MDRQWVNREADAPAGRRQMRQVTQPLLAVAGLSKTFPGLKALIDVDFAVCSGEIVALVGQNGYGKSTLVKVLTGIDEGDPGARVTLGRPGRWSRLRLDVRRDRSCRRADACGADGRRERRGPGGLALSVRGLAGGTVRGLDVDVRSGEVVGLSGILGSGASTSRPYSPVRCLAAMVTWRWPGSRFPQVTRAPRSVRGSPTSLAIAAPMAR